MTSAVLVVALSLAGQSPQGAYPAAQAPAKVAPAPQAPAKVAPAPQAPSKIAPAPQAPAKIAPAPQAPAKMPRLLRPRPRSLRLPRPRPRSPRLPGPGQGRPAPQAPAKIAPAPQAPAKYRPGSLRSGQGCSGSPGPGEVSPRLLTLRPRLLRLPRPRRRSPRLLRLRPRSPRLLRLRPRSPRLPRLRPRLLRLPRVFLTLPPRRLPSIESSGSSRPSSILRGLTAQAGLGWFWNAYRRRRVSSTRPALAFVVFEATNLQAVVACDRHQRSNSISSCSVALAIGPGKGMRP